MPLHVFSSRLRARSDQCIKCIDFCQTLAFPGRPGVEARVLGALTPGRRAPVCERRWYTWGRTRFRHQLGDGSPCRSGLPRHGDAQCVLARERAVRRRLSQTVDTDVIRYQGLGKQRPRQERVTLMRPGSTQVQGLRGPQLEDDWTKAEWTKAWSYAWDNARWTWWPSTSSVRQPAITRQEAWPVRQPARSMAKALGMRSKARHIARYNTRRKEHGDIGV